MRFLNRLLTLLNLLAILTILLVIGIGALVYHQFSDNTWLHPDSITPDQLAELRDRLDER